MKLRTTSLVGLTVLLLSSGCALLSKGESVQPRFFGVDNFAKEPPQPAPAHREVRLGRIEAADHLRERLVYREPSGELGFYEERLWGERPENYARRALSHALFEQAQMQQVLHGDAPTLEVEVLAFEEVRLVGKAPIGRVTASVALQDDRVVVWQETMTVERPIPAPPRGKAPDANATVRALTDALHELAHQIAARVVLEVQKIPASTGSGGTESPAPQPQPTPAK